MSRLVLKLLGPPEVGRDGSPVKFRSRKELALLLYLVTEGGMHAREKLVELFWPRSGESRGRANLRNALSSLRKTLTAGAVAADAVAADAVAADAVAANADSEDPCLAVERYYVGFDPTAEVELDLWMVEAAESAAAPGTERSETTSRSQVLARLRDAVEAHRGGFLEGFYLEDAPDFDHWTEVQRESWRRRLDTIYERLSELQMEGGEFLAAIETAVRWAESDPTEEAAHQRLVEAYSAAGDRRAALAAYESYRAKLERESGASPGTRIEALAARLQSEFGSPAAHRDTSAHRFRAAGEPVSLDVPLVGRSEEFGSLIAEYHAARRGPRGVAVIGEAGVGKTRLVDEFLLWAEAQGAEVLRGQASEDRSLPYGPIMDAFRQRIERERAPDDLLDDLWLSELSRLLPEIRDRYPDLPKPAGDVMSSKAQLLEAIHQLIMALAARAEPEPVVAFIDDWQWVDNASLTFRRYGGRRWPQENAPILIITSIREEALEFDPEVYQRLMDARRDIPIRRLSLEPLGPEETTELLGSLTNGGGAPGASGGLDAAGVGRWLYGETGGLPFFLVETLQMLIDRGVLAPHTRPDGGYAFEVRESDTRSLEGMMPAGVRDAVKGRISRLDEPAKNLLAAGAVLGRSFSYEILFQVAKLDEEEGLAALDEAISSRLLREARTGENFIALNSGQSAYPSHDEVDYGFAHDKTREVAYTEAGEARRRVLHLRALQALEEAGAPAAELARHALAAASSEKAFHHSLAAGDEAMSLFAVEDAVQHHERARSLYEDPRSSQRVCAAAGPSDGPRLYERLGYCYKLLFQWTQALDAYERMLAEAREVDDREAEWEALNSLAMLGTDYTVQPEEEDELLRGMQRRAEDQSEPATGPDTPQDFVWSPEYARERAEEALSLAREIGGNDLVANSLYAVALLDGWSGHWGRVVEICAEARSLYAAMGDRALDAEILALSAWGEVMEGRPQEAVRFGRAQLAVARELADRDIVLADAHGLVLALLETGGYEEALSLGSQSVEAARSLGAPERLQVSLTLLGDVHKTLLRLDEARMMYSELSSLAVFPQYRALAHSKLCTVAALRGDWEDAHYHALEAAKLRGEIVLQLTDPFHRYHEVEALLRGGDEELARDELERFGEHASSHRRIRVAYLRARSVLDRYTEKMAAAIEHLREAEKLAEEIGLPGELWQIRSTLAELHEAGGDREETLRLFSLAVQNIEMLAGKIEDEDLRSGFLDSNLIRQVLAKASTR